VRESLRGGLGVNPELEVLPVGTLPRVEQGKAKRVLDRAWLGDDPRRPGGRRAPRPRHLEIVERSPDKYVAACGCTEYIRRCRDGEVQWSIDGVCAELDRLLATGKFVAIGESLPYMPYPWDKTALVSRVDAIANILRIVEVAQQHDVAARIHTGIPYGYTAAYSYGYIRPRTSTRCDARRRGRLPRRHADLRPRRRPGRLVGALLRGVPGRDRGQRQRLRRDRPVVARALREAAHRPQHRAVEALVGHGLGREHADLLAAGTPSPRATRSSCAAMASRTTRSTTGAGACAS